MANKGYDETKIKLLFLTNWLSTVIFILLGIFTIWILVKAVP